MDEYDVIVVGLGCAGISTALYCAKKGLKVLGIEQLPSPGSFGSSSFGETRQWSAIYGSEMRNNMMFSAVKMWKEIEEECKEKLIHSLSFLCMGTLENERFKEIIDFHPKANLLNATEICGKFPALKNVPSDYIGILTTDGGIVHSKKALNVCRDLVEKKYGAKLLFNTKVVKFSKNQVETNDGTTYSAKYVVMTCGVYSVNYTTCSEIQINKNSL